MINPFSQIKREYGEILEDADFANRISLIYIVLTIKREGGKKVANSRFSVYSHFYTNPLPRNNQEKVQHRQTKQYRKTNTEKVERNYKMFAHALFINLGKYTFSNMSYPPLNF